MNEPELWLPEKIETLPAIWVRPNGTADTCLRREVGKYHWEEKPRSILNYYRPATEAEKTKLLEAA